MKTILLLSIVLLTFSNINAQNKKLNIIDAEKAKEICNTNNLKEIKYSTITLVYPDKKDGPKVDLDIFINDSLLTTLKPNSVFKHYRYYDQELKLSASLSLLKSDNRKAMMMGTVKTFSNKIGNDVFFEFELGVPYNAVVHKIDSYTAKKKIENIPLENIHNISPVLDIFNVEYISYSSINIVYPNNIETNQFSYDVYINDTLLRTCNPNELLHLNCSFKGKIKISACPTSLSAKRIKEVLLNTEKTINIKGGNDYYFKLESGVPYKKIITNMSLKKSKQTLKNIPENNKSILNSLKPDSKTAYILALNFYFNKNANEIISGAEIFINDHKVSYLSNDYSLTIFREFESKCNIKINWAGISYTSEKTIFLNNPEDYYIKLTPTTKTEKSIIINEINYLKHFTNIKSQNRLTLIGQSPIKKQLLVVNNKCSEAVIAKVEPEASKQELNAKSSITPEKTIGSETIKKAEILPVIDKNNSPKIAPIPKVINKTKNPDFYKFALIIGNEDYYSKNTELSEEVNVKYAKKDALTFKNYANSALGIPEDNIMLLLDATAIEMHRAIKKLSLLSKVSEGRAKLYFYYAGHGVPHEITKEAYLIPVNIDASDLEFALSLSKLYESLTQYPAERITVMLDACFSGGGRKYGLVASRGVRVVPKSNSLNGNIVVFSASSDQQTALPYAEKEHGMFTYYLLQKLEESNGNCTYEELAKYLKRNVSIKSVLINNKEQVPKVNISSSLQKKWKDWHLND